MAQEVEEVIKRLETQPGVIGVLVMDREGRAIRSTLNQEQTQQYCGLLEELVSKGRQTAAGMEAGNEMSFLRLRTTKAELMLVPDPATGYVTAVLQNPHGDLH